MRKGRQFIATMAVLCPWLAGCGTHVPEIQEIGGDAVTGQQMVQAIVQNVTCEVRDAVARLYEHKKHKYFLDTWGVQLTLNLTVEEKSAVSPSASVLSGTMFTLGLGAAASSDATRIDKVNSYLTIAQLRQLGPCVPGMRQANGAMLMASDLRLAELLFDMDTSENTQAINFDQDTTDGPFKQTVISHEVKFEVLTSGSLTPSWKLARASINPTGTFLSTQRDRTHDLIITLGPTDKTGKAPSNMAANSALASDISVGVSNGVKAAITQ